MDTPLILLTIFGALSFIFFWALSLHNCWEEKIIKRRENPAPDLLRDIP
jgi:hypothetical protein